MDNYVKTFKYSTIDAIQCFYVDRDQLYTLTRTMLYGWDLKSKKLFLEKEHSITANKCILYQDDLYFIAKDALYNFDFEKIYTLKFSTIDVEIQGKLFLIDESEIIIFDNSKKEKLTNEQIGEINNQLKKLINNSCIKSYDINEKKDLEHELDVNNNKINTNKDINKPLDEEPNINLPKSGNLERKFIEIKHKLNSGFCTSAVILEDSLFLSFENGKIFEINTNDFTNGCINKFNKIIDLKETIISIDKCGDKIAAGTINKKIYLIKKEDYTYKFTKLTIDVKRVCCRNKEIFILDLKNNLQLFDDGLKIKGICSGVIDIDTKQEDIFIALEKKRILQLYDYNDYKQKETNRIPIYD
ncbi:hypothetical protein H311_03231 [Anncaliia algerae PRA109]|nr:hypothetical protein H311_03231 [Anncaliia algerae PRA109]